MRGFLVRRLGELLVVFFGVTLVIYAMVFSLPGDPIAALAGDRPLSPAVVAELRERYHLDDPLWLQYLRYVGGLVQGDLGTDFSGRSVAASMASRWPTTILLALTAWLIQVGIGVGLGVVAALRRGTWVDRGVLAITVLATSVPVFVVAVGAQLFVGVRWRLLPIAGDAQGWPTSYLLPGAVIAVFSLAALARLTRGSMVEVLTSDFVRTLRAKGLSEPRVVGLHVMRSSVIPVVTFLGIDLGFLLGGAVVAEGVFNLPGIGQLLFSAVREQQGPVVVGVSTALVLIFLLSSVVVDVLASLLDPRIRKE